MPHRTFREIVVFVIGSTPQIITETIYALSQEDPPVQPDEVYVITTSHGRKKIEGGLLKDGLIGDLFQEYDLRPVELTNSSFILISDDRGKEIDDIRSEQDNRHTGDAIASLIRKLAEDPLNRLHCCLAGGRKTMSFYLGAALQLFGRPWDKLYHVLVTPEFESQPEFFYKPKENRIIEQKMPDGSVKRLNTDDAEIILAELPFIRLREKLDLRGKGFEELVTEGQSEIDTATVQPGVCVDLSARTLYIGPRLVEMVPVQLMLYTSFLRRKVTACKQPDRGHCADCTECFATIGEMVSTPLLERMGQDYGQIYGGSPGKSEELLGNWQGNDGVKAIRQNRSKINRVIQECLNDEPFAPLYAINSVKHYGDTRYGVRVEKGKIRIE
jgi:CRISPR-associated protein Csx14